MKVSPRLLRELRVLEWAYNKREIYEALDKAALRCETRGGRMITPDDFWGPDTHKPVCDYYRDPLKLGDCSCA